MSLIRMHFARGEISDRSFKCLDLTFFQEQKQSIQYNPHKTEEEQKGAGSSNPEETKNGAVDYARMG